MQHLLNVISKNKRVSQLVLYEYPINERIRSLMRLEYLFKRLFAFISGTSPMHQHVALSLLFEIMDTCDRAEVRSGILQDVDRQKSNLENYRHHPNIDLNALDSAIADLNRVSAALMGKGRIGQAARENEWLMSLKNRFAVPGGTSQIDIPSYHAWQLSAEENRQRAITQWVEPFMPLFDGVSVVLKMLRESGSPVDASTQEGGVFQEMLGGKIYQMVRVWVSGERLIYPEISANKYVVWVRFSELDNQYKTQLITTPTAFKMSFCNV
jgi:cell division protein ZapD